MSFNGSDATIVAANTSIAYALLHQSLALQVLFSLLVVCLSTRIVSARWFHAVKYGTERNVKPPTIPYWIPFLRHAFSMAWDSPKFTAQCLNQYGDGTPFFVDAGVKKILILLDPAQIKRVMNASQELDPNPFIHEMILGQMLGSPQATVDFYKGDNGQMDRIQMAHIRQHVTGTALIKMSGKVFERFNSNCARQYFETAVDWVEIPDLFEFVQDQVTYAITEALMGTTITKEHPELINDQWTFMDSSIEIVMGLPRLVIPTAYAARDRLLATLKQWSRKSEVLRTQNQADPHWDAHAGSGLLQERQELFANSPGFDEDARISQLLGLLFAGTSVTPPVTFWYLFETLKNPALLKQIASEINNHYDPTTGSYDFMQLTVRPILQSLHAETTRYYASNVSVRVVTTPNFSLDDKYTIDKGTTIFIYNKFTGQFTPGWTEARAQSTVEPLDVFWPQRFLTSGQDKRERFTDAGFGGCWTSFGGGEHKCPGRHFARNIGIAVLAVLLGEYECELLDANHARCAAPAVKERAFGKMMPTEKVAARIRKRQRG